VIAGPAPVIDILVGQCTMKNKLEHWQTALDLHAKCYSLSEPFTVPTLLSNASVSGLKVRNWL
jgi:hypothetical protein